MHDKALCRFKVLFIEDDVKLWSEEEVEDAESGLGRFSCRVSTWSASPLTRWPWQSGNSEVRRTSTGPFGHLGGRRLGQWRRQTRRRPRRIPLFPGARCQIWLFRSPPQSIGGDFNAPSSSSPVPIHYIQGRRRHDSVVIFSGSIVLSSLLCFLLVFLSGVSVDYGISGLIMLVQLVWRKK